MHKTAMSKFDFRPLGQEIKRRRLEMGWSQAYLGQLVDRTQRSIMNFENKGTKPSFDVLYKIVTLLDISVDQFFYPDMHTKDYQSSSIRKLDFLVQEMDERELSILLSTAEGIINAKKYK